MEDMESDSKRFYSWIGRHVFNRIKISIYDYQGGESYCLDIPEAVYEELKRLIKSFEIDEIRDLQRRQ